LAVLRATLVTLDCTPFGISMSVNGPADAVCSPAVLRLRGHGEHGPLMVAGPGCV